MPKSQRDTPADLCPDWPSSPSTSPEGEVARILALRLRASIPYRGVRKIPYRGVRKVANRAGVDEGTIRNILSGARWPDLRTVVRLEVALGVALWLERTDEGDPQ